MHERMLDKNTTPTFNQMVEYCGEGGELLIELNKYLTKVLELNTSIRFPYGNSYGWSVKYTKNGKLICDVFAEKGGCCVMLRMTNKQFGMVYDELTDYSKKIIDNKYVCGEGGWMHLRVDSEHVLSDAKKLLAVK